MQVHCDEGIANRIDPKPCAVIREDGGEANNRQSPAPPREDREHQEQRYAEVAAVLAPVPAPGCRGVRAESLVERGDRCTQQVRDVGRRVLSWCAQSSGAVELSVQWPGRAG